MRKNLPPSASVATQLEGEKLHAPAAARNADAISELLRRHAPSTGRALEIASGTGQHICCFARDFPDLQWLPTEIEPARIASIDAHRLDAGLTNLSNAQYLDATAAGWGSEKAGNDLILVVNLLHLITIDEAGILLSEAVSALKKGGRLVVYGPFKRNGDLTSEGDARFDKQLRSTNPDVGYKNDQDVENWLRQAGVQSVECVDMPANNLAFIAKR